MSLNPAQTTKIYRELQRLVTEDSNLVDILKNIEFYIHGTVMGICYNNQHIEVYQYGNGQIILGLCANGPQSLVTYEFCDPNFLDGLKQAIINNLKGIYEHTMFESKTIQH